MPNKFASGKYAIAQCDRCDQRYKLKELRTQILKTKPYKIKVCRTCWDPDHPQLSLGLYPVDDPQAVREPRPDVSYLQSGSSGLQINLTGVGPDGFGSIEMGHYQCNRYHRIFFLISHCIAQFRYKNL